MFEIRPYHPSDLAALYRICLLTGDSGKDASAIHNDSELLGHIYAAPYAVLEPDLCFVLTRHHAPVGYVLGTRDSLVFGERCEREWFLPLRLRYPLPPENDTSRDAQMIRALHRGHRVDPRTRAEEKPDEYPAHLHIDLLPLAQGQGWGTKIMDRFLAQLRHYRVSGVHLWVGARNSGGVAFYRRYGFSELAAFPQALQFGLRLL